VEKSSYIFNLDYFIYFRTKKLKIQSNKYAVYIQSIRLLRDFVVAIFYIDFSEFSRISMDLCEFSCIFSEFFSFFRVCMNLYEFSWIFSEFFSFFRVCMNLYEFSWIFSGLFRLFTNFHEFVRIVLDFLGCS
jgi:hypothetical protein